MRLIKALNLNQLALKQKNSIHHISGRTLAGLFLYGIVFSSTAAPDDAHVLEKSSDVTHSRSALRKLSAAKTPTRNIQLDSVSESEDIASTSNIVMYSGEVITIQTDGITRVAIGNGKLISATVIDGKKLLIIAQDVGDTNILLWKNDKKFQNIKLRVTALDTSRVLSEVQRLLSDIPGSEAKMSGDRIYIDGENLAREKLAIIKSIKEQYPNIIDRTTATPKQPRPIPPSSMLMFDVYFLEFKQSYLQNLGVQWQKSFNGVNFGLFGEATNGQLNLRPGVGGTNGTTYDPPLPSTKINGISSALNISGSIPGLINLAVTNGQATLLAAPKLAVRSGGKAKFLAGGEFPIPISGITGNTVEYKQYGILLEVNPVVNEDQTVSGTISTEVSALDSSVTVNGFPGVLKRRTETDFYTNMGQAIVLSGLYTQESSQADDKVPLLGDLPVLNSLFKSRGESRKNTELVVFIIPTSHSAQDKVNSDVIKATKENSLRFIKKMTEEDILPKLKLDSQIWKGNSSEFTEFEQTHPNQVDIKNTQFPGYVN